MNKEEVRRISGIFGVLRTQLNAALRRYTEFCKDLPELERLVGETAPWSRLLAAFHKFGPDLPGDVPNLDELEGILREIHIMKACHEMIEPLKAFLVALDAALERFDAL